MSQDSDALELKDPRATSREKLSRRVMEQQREDLGAILSTPGGRRYLMRISGEAERMKFTPMTGNSWTFFNLGVSQHGAQIWNEAEKHFPELCILARTEHMNQKKETSDE